MKASLALLALVSTGCFTSNIRGGTNGSPIGSSSGGSSGGASSAGASTAGATTGQGATGSAGASSTGTGGTSGGGNTTSGTTTGACLKFEDQTCDSNGACCSGACLQICRQPEGQQCLTDTDCSSGNCFNDVCACGTPTQNQQVNCASDADCCNGLPCQLTVSSEYGQYGICCNPIGKGCQGNWDCCDSNCVNGMCTCLGVDTENCQPGQCCKGACVQNGNGGGGSVCLNGPGDPCNGPWACINSNCVNGSCGTCSASTGGLCATTADCCAGGVCAVNLVIPGQYGSGPAVDAGLACCADTGSSCDGGENRQACCSGQCSEGLCTCAHVTDQCFNSASCCAGEACMTRASGGSGQLACCQSDGQFCLGDQECCSGSCQNNGCACVPDGGACGPAGNFAAEGPAACCSGVCGDAGTCY